MAKLRADDELCIDRLYLFTLLLLNHVMCCYSGYQSHAPSNSVFSRLKIEFLWTSVICFHDNSSRSGAWGAGQFVSKMAFQSPFQRFLVDFAYSSNTFEEESQEYEDVESSQIYIPDSDKTEIVDNDNETVSRSENLPRICQTLSASCTRRLDCFVRKYVM